MRKSVFILLAIVLCFVLIVSCNDSPAGGGSESAPTDNMTESYRNARKVFHDSTSIWLPELEGVEVADADIEITKTDYKPLINLSFAGNEELFNQLVALFTSVIGNPDSNMSNETFKFWEAEYSDGGQLYMGNTSVSLLGENKDKIAMHGHFFRAFTVTLNANPAAGGTVKINQAGTDYGTTITSTEGSDIDLVATAADGYEFAGWYLGDTKLSDKANFMDYEVPSSSVAIEGRFSQPEMTESFTAGRAQIHTLSGIWILPLSDVNLLASSDLNAENGVVCFDIAASRETFETLFADMKQKLGDVDGGDEDGGYWNIENTIEGSPYEGSISIMYDPECSPLIGSAVYINCVMSRAYYATGRQELIDKGIITLPDVDGLSYSYGYEEISWWIGLSDEEFAEVDVCFDFDIGVTEEVYQAFYDCIVSLCGNEQIGGYPTYADSFGNPCSADDPDLAFIDNKWLYNEKTYNLYWQDPSDADPFMAFNLIQ